MCRGLTCLFLIPGLILMGGCATFIPRVGELKGEAGESRWLPRHMAPSDSILAPAGPRASQSDDGSAVMLTALVATAVMLGLAALSIYLAWTLGEG